ncbi:hypothetical protein K4L44_11125 [Halosquirtibacter laminarini]|uniref:Uncharacterized protein n=1 Tax=Halosquirtibacter laminarini TaxID=3374600 RepID=A0AC61NIG7_9BACT|nr:hypothetical protein K4L44_11125 [Prolixibacteraceae bacterium]
MTRKQITTTLHIVQNILSVDKKKIAKVEPCIQYRNSQILLGIMIIGYVLTILIEHFFHIILDTPVRTNSLYLIITKPIILYTTLWLGSWTTYKAKGVTHSNLPQKDIFSHSLYAYLPVWIVLIITTIIPWLYILWIFAPYGIYVLYHLISAKKEHTRENAIRLTIATVLLYLCFYLGTSLLLRIIVLK